MPLNSLSLKKFWKRNRPAIPSLFQSAKAFLIQSKRVTVLQSATVIRMCDDYFKVRKNRLLCQLWCSHLLEEKTKRKADYKVCKKKHARIIKISCYCIKISARRHYLSIKDMKTYCSEWRVIGFIYHIKQETNRETRRKLLWALKYSLLGYHWCLAQHTLNSDIFQQR